MKNFKQLTDARMNSLTWNTEEGMRRLRASQEPEMRRMRRPLIATIALLMALLTATALAVGIRMSRRVDVKRIAREAVMQTYGLDAKSIGMFTEHARETNGAWIVTYGVWNPKNAGEYTVTVQEDGTAQASWSLEGQENAWGQIEIAAYIEQKDAVIHEMQQAEAQTGPAAPEPVPTLTPAPGAKLTHQQAIEAANEALRTQYDFKDAGLNEFDATAEFNSQSGMWMVEYSASGWHWKDGYLSEKAGEYYVEVEDAAGQAVSAMWTLEGVDDGKYIRETFGQARTYNAQCMEWVAEIRAEFNTAYTAVETSRWPVSVEEMARLDGLMIASGFDAEKFNHVVPGEGDLTLDEALELTAQVLATEYGVTREVFDASSFAYTDLTQEKTHRQWYFWVQNHDIQMGWTITLNAQTGEILDLSQESFAAGNG